MTMTYPPRENDPSEPRTMVFSAVFSDADEQEKPGKIGCVSDRKNLMSLIYVITISPPSGEPKTGDFWSVVLPRRSATEER
jgi:hypothetical protein